MVTQKHPFTLPRKQVRPGPAPVPCQFQAGNLPAGTVEFNLHPTRPRLLQAHKRSVFRYWLLLPILLPLLFAGGCELFQVSFDEDNHRDPSNPGYIPSPPAELTIRKSNINPRNIDIRWEIQSVGHDGFLIEKSMEDDQSFEEFARLAPDRTDILDVTRYIAPGIWYRVTSYVERDGVLHRHLTDPLHIGFGDFTSVEQAWLAQSTPRIYRFGLNWRDNIERTARDGYDIVAIREDGHEYLLVSINPTVWFEYSIRESYEGPDGDQFRFIRIDAFYLEGDEKRIYSSLLTELDILF